MWLPEKKICAFALTEPDAGSDIASMRSRAVRNGEGYVLHGVKNFNSGIDFADMTLVYAKTDPAAGIKGISAFIVEKGTPGFSFRVTGQMLGFRGIHHRFMRAPTRFREMPWQGYSCPEGYCYELRRI